MWEWYWASYTATHYSYRSCLTIETYVVNLQAHSFCADVNGRRGLEMCSTSGTTFKHYVPQHSVTACYFEPEVPKCFKFAITLLRVDCVIPMREEIS